MTRKRWLLAPVYLLLCSLFIGQVAHAGGPRSNHILTSHPVRGWRLCRNHAQRRDITVSGALVATPNVGAQNVLQNRTTLGLG